VGAHEVAAPKAVRCLADQVSALLGISRSKLARMIARGLIVAPMRATLGPKGVRYWLSRECDDIARVVNRHGTGSACEPHLRALALEHARQRESPNGQSTGGAPRQGRRVYRAIMV